MYVSEESAYALWEQQCYNLKSINNVKKYNFLYLVYIWIGNVIVLLCSIFKSLTSAVWSVTEKAWKYNSVPGLVWTS